MTAAAPGASWDGLELIQPPPAPRLPKPYAPAWPAPSAFRVPPQAIEVEKHVIGALFLDPEAMAEVSAILTPADFYMEKNGLILAAAQAVHRARLPVDMISVSEQMKKAGTFDAAGGDGYLMEIGAEVVSSANAAQHAGIIKEKAGLRNVIGLATGILERAYNESDISPVVESFEKAAAAARAGSGITKGLRILSPDVWVPKVAAAYHRKNPRGLSARHGQGFDQLYTLSPAQTNVWTGIPGHGKSEFLDATMQHMAEDHGWIVGYFTPENDPQEDHVIKLVEKRVGKPVHGIGCMTEAEYEGAYEWVLERFRWLDQQDEGCTFAQVLAMAERIQPPLNALVVDPWNMLEEDAPKGMTETKYILHCLRMARRWAKRTQISLHIVAHPSKLETDFKTGAIKIPNLYDISGSANWFNTIDNGFTVYIDPETGRVRIIVQKIRWTKKNGRIGEQEFTYDPPTGRYTEIGPPKFYRTPAKSAPVKSKPAQKPTAPPRGPDGDELAF